MLVWMLIAGLALVALLGFAVCSRQLETNNPRGDVVTGVVYSFGRWYARRFHKLRTAGTNHIPTCRAPGPMIVVANHTAGIDPLLIQTACPFEIRWMMAADMRHPRGEPFWKWMKIIFVDRTRPDTKGLRQAIRHVKSGGVLGIFPEGKIERPQGTLLPFQRGVGTLVKQTGATVLPVVIQGTPYAPTAWGSLVKRSNARLSFLEPVSFANTKATPREIVDDLASRFCDVLSKVDAHEHPGTHVAHNDATASSNHTAHTDSYHDNGATVKPSRIGSSRASDGRVVAGM